MKLKPVFVLVVLGFAFVQLLALANGAAFTQMIQSGALEPVFPNPAEPANAFLLFAYVLFGAVAMLLLLKYYKGIKLFLLVELFLLFASFQVLFAFFAGEPASTALAALVAGLRLWKPATKNFLLLVVAGVVGGLLGANLGLLPALLLAVLLAFYDVVAVFFTKHMVVLAKGFAERGGSFSVTFALPGLSRARPQKEAGERAGKVFAERESLEVGTGDFVIPALVTASACGADSSLGVFVDGLWVGGAGVASAVGVVAGAVLLLALIQKRRGYFPALPPLVFCSLAALAAYALF
ncbi:MAG: presenilin family intramembrane aspartyl protease [Candidatus Micrarchaeia archaeon]